MKTDNDYSAFIRSKLKQLFELDEEGKHAEAQTCFREELAPDKSGVVAAEIAHIYRIAPLAEQYHDAIMRRRKALNEYQALDESDPRDEALFDEYETARNAANDIEATLFHHLSNAEKKA